MTLRVRWKGPVKSDIASDPENSEGNQDLEIVMAITTSGYRCHLTS